MATRLHTVHLADDVYLAVKGLWSQGSVRTVVDRALRAYLELPAAGVEIPVKKIEDSKPLPAWPTTPPAVPQEKTALDVVATTGGKVTVATALPAPPSPLCRRCGHPATKHWEKGCLAGCNCSEGRYRP